MGYFYTPNVLTNSQSFVIYSDNEIIEGIRQNNQAVLHAFYKMHFGSIHHLVVQNGGDEQEAKDVYQDGVIVLYEKIRDNKLALSSSLKTFLYSICRNLWLKQLDRKDKHVGKIEDQEEFFVVEEEEVKDMQDEINRHEGMKLALDKLGEPCKSLITDYYINDLNMQQMTAKFGYTNADNTKNQKYKCMNRLKKYFFELYKK